MIESLITVTIIGLLAGIILSMPIAGPVSIIITSNALKGNNKFALRTAMGCALSEFFYVFAAIFGISFLYSLYKPAVPYILMVGAIFLFLVGLKIFNSKLGFEHLDDSDVKKPKVKGGFRTGVMINLMNPSLFVNWLVASFMIFSFASSIGLNVGKLNLIVAENVKEIQNYSEESLPDLNLPEDFDSEIVANDNESSSIVLGLLYATGEAAGTYIWFSLLVGFIVKYRAKLNLRVMNYLVKILALILMSMASFLFYRSIMLIT